jgi:hypothetical protein
MAAWAAARRATGTRNGLHVVGAVELAFEAVLEAGKY